MSATAQPRVHVALADRPDGRVAIVTLDNQAKLNALSRALLVEFAESIARLGEDEGLRAIVVTGAGERAFTGGANIDEMAAIDGPDAARDFITQVHLACAAVRAAPIPVIARVRGFCFGAGLELVASCDFRVAAADARFGMPEVRLGIPSVVEAALLPQLIGWGRTRRLLYTGETIGSLEALAWGLVEDVVPAAELDATLEARLADILACGPTAIRQQKALIRAWESRSPEDAIAVGVEAFADAYRTDEPRRMMAGFLAAQAARKAAR
jgi:enoyl-CoA hydratase/carnithine racemase